MYVALDGRLAGVIGVADTVKPESRDAVAQLRALGLEVWMLTGDNQVTADVVARQVGIDRVIADVRPEDKAARIAALRNDGAVVAMVGDGINDAPALATASVGIAMGGGTDVALETADAALLGGRVAGVAALVRLSRATMRNIHQNVAVSLGLKAVFLVTTMIGVTGLWPAILADTGATVIVTMNALRLLRHRSPASRHGTFRF
jgi:Cd2+/Zn2+-exporting ATPase